MRKAGIYPAFLMRKLIGLGREPTLVKSPAQASRVRSAFARRTEFFEAKHVGTFNASAARQRILRRLKCSVSETERRSSTEHSER